MEGDVESEGNSCAPAAPALDGHTACRGVNPAEHGGGAWGKGKDSLVLNFHWDDPTPVLSGESEGHCRC